MTPRLRRVLLVTAAITATSVVPAWAYLATTTQASMTLTVARLSPPSAEVAVDAEDAVITPVPPSLGPEPTSYDVARVSGEAGPTTVCAAITPGTTCRDAGALADPASSSPPVYVVTAHLGDFWTADSSPVTAPVPPGGAVEPPTASPAAAPEPDPTQSPSIEPSIVEPSPSEPPPAEPSTSSPSAVSSPA